VLLAELAVAIRRRWPDVTEIIFCRPSRY